MKLEELGRIDVDSFKESQKIPIVIVLDNLRSGMNVGAFFRTSDAFKVERVILCGITPRPPHREILKTAIGSNASVDWSYKEKISDALKSLIEDDYVVLGIEQTDRSVSLPEYEVNTSVKYALVFGNEVEGLSPETLPSLDDAIEIPQFGTKHSLNVAVCGGIVIWHFAHPFLAD